jgi:hypothetical protein
VSCLLQAAPKVERLQLGDEFRNLSVSKWPTSEIDFKPGKLLAQKFAEFAAGSFTAL